MDKQKVTNYKIFSLSKRKTKETEAPTNKSEKSDIFQKMWTNSKLGEFTFWG